MTPASPGRALRLSLLAWGLGDMATGRTTRGAALACVEVLAAVAVAVATVLFVDTTWYLVPFLAGMGFIGLWAVQAVLAYRYAGHLAALEPAGPMDPTPRTGSRAGAVAWLTVPLLVWGTGFWLVAADSATPGAVVDRFVSAWPQVDEEALDASLAVEPARVGAAAAEALDELDVLCAAGRLPDDCGDARAALLRGVRVRIERPQLEEAVAVAEVVRYERRPSRFLGIFEGSELVPVPIRSVLTLELGTQAAALGANRWVILNAEAGP